MNIFAAFLGAYVVGVLFMAGVIISYSSSEEKAYALSPQEEYIASLEARVTNAVITPVYIYIPKIDIKTSVEAVGKNKWGNMAIPSSYETVAWYKEGVKPGESGSAVLAGHLDNSLGVPAVFSKLSTLKAGDVIYLESAEGLVRKYRVADRAVYDYDLAPRGELFTREGKSVLTLITCDGAWNEARRSYQDRLVLTAEPF